MSVLDACLFGCVVAAMLSAAVACRAAWIMRARVDRAYRQIGVERVAAAGEIERMLKVLTDAGEHDLALAALMATAPPVTEKSPLA